MIQADFHHFVITLRKSLRNLWLFFSRRFFRKYRVTKKYFPMFINSWRKLRFLFSARYLIIILAKKCIVIYVKTLKCIRVLSSVKKITNILPK